jgi:hypothetical protein
MPDPEIIAAAVAQEAAEAVAAYLHARESVPVGARLREIEEQFWTAQPLVRYRLAEERAVLREAYNSAVERAVEPYEADFIALAKIYAREHRITYKAFRRLGVPRRVLDNAGIKQPPKQQQILPFFAEMKANHYVPRTTVEQSP